MKEFSVSKGVDFYGPNSGFSGITLNDIAQSSTGFGSFLADTFSGISSLILATKGVSNGNSRNQSQQPTVIIQQPNPNQQNPNLIYLIFGGALVLVLVLVLALRK
jgi:hypothetical protein